MALHEQLRDSYRATTGTTEYFQRRVIGRLPKDHTNMEDNLRSSIVNINSRGTPILACYQIIRHSDQKSSAFPRSVKQTKISASPQEMITADVFIGTKHHLRNQCFKTLEYFLNQMSCDGGYRLTYKDSSITAVPSGLSSRVLMPITGSSSSTYGLAPPLPAQAAAPVIATAPANAPLWHGCERVGENQPGELMPGI